ncbi:MAG: GC-type dockerin domain-anchored protein [Planctomycetota bacterium]|nr:GC-type dockerin domain-anchored protein [Planctomycetota bacterium]
MLPTTSRRSCLALLALSLLAGTASAQWTARILSPSTGGVALGVDGGRAAGSITVGGVKRAAYWAVGATNAVNITPSGASESVARGFDGNQIVGYGQFSGFTRAGMWTGTTASTWVSLNPAGYQFSDAFAVGDGEQGGYVSTNGSTFLAALWRGTAASFVDLTPPGQTFCNVYGVGGGQQCGSCGAGASRAYLWRGTKASAVNLTPPGSAQAFAYDTDGVHQVGIYGAPDGTYHACMWSGTAAPYVDLHPQGQGFTYSYAFGVDANLQVGYVFDGNKSYASLWRGSASTWVNLNQYLPPGNDFSACIARSVWRDANFIYVAGEANGRAVLWQRPRCRPDFNGDDFVDFTDFDAFVEAFESGAPGSDFNEDGFVDFTDFDQYVTAFEAGC